MWGVFGLLSGTGGGPKGISTSIVQRKTQGFRYNTAGEENWSKESAKRSGGSSQGRDWTQVELVEIAATGC